MNILILGYGKMGKTIEKIALDRGHRIVEKIDLDNHSMLMSIDPSCIDVAIEFSQPDAAYQNIHTCLQMGIPVISGTTGWLDKKNEIKDICAEKNGTFFYASNFSIGVNIFFKINKLLAGIMNRHPEYQPSMIEIHHTKKKDAPSGTAISLAEGLIDQIDQINRWENQETPEPEVLGIKSIRKGNIPGIHSISYRSSKDEIMIKHEAYGREGFAMGAVLVAEWIIDKQGVLGMDDFLNI